MWNRYFDTETVIQHCYYHALRIIRLFAKHSQKLNPWRLVQSTFHR